MESHQEWVGGAASFKSSQMYKTFFLGQLNLSFILENVVLFTKFLKNLPVLTEFLKLAHGHGCSGPTVTFLVTSGSFQPNPPFTEGAFWWHLGWFLLEETKLPPLLKFRYSLDTFANLFNMSKGLLRVEFVNSFAKRASAKQGRPCCWEKADVGQREDRHPLLPALSH